MPFYDYDDFDELDLNLERIEKNVVQKTDAIFSNPQQHGMNPREGQYRLALDIAESIRSRNHLLAEAGVGIGKTYAYLIPGMLAANLTGDPLIVATSSIALTKQLMDDVEKAKKITNLHHLQAELVKGANNYVCRNRVDECLNNLNQLKRGIYPKHKSLDTRLLDISSQLWRDAQHCYDRDTFNNSVPPWFWQLIQCRQDLCQKTACSHNFSCEFRRMRRMVKNTGSAKIIIANQDVLIASMKNQFRHGQGFINDNPCLLVIDEGHNFEEKARASLTEKFTLEQLINPLKKLQQLSLKIEVSNELIDELVVSYKCLEVYFETMVKQVTKTIEKDPEKRFKSRFSIPRLGSPEVFLRMSKIIKSINTSILFHSRAKNAQTEQLTTKAFEIASFLESLCEYYHGGNPLFWGEGDITKPQTLTLCWAPKDIDQVLNRWLFSQNQYPVIITSATLCQPGDKTKEKYQYQSNTLGFCGRYTPSQPSPFDYNSNALLYIGADLPDPSSDREQHLQETAFRIEQLLFLTKGRTLILFTAKEDMIKVSLLLEQQKLPWPIYLQKSGNANQDLLKSKLIHNNGVLLSTNFWEGFNVPGPALSQVIIVRLPFPVPDPVWEYKASLVDNSFDILLPEMLIKLRQGAGRLIRQESDIGLLSILDPRLGSIMNKMYRHNVLNSLPIKNFTESLNKALEFCTLKNIA